MMFGVRVQFRGGKNAEVLLWSNIGRSGSGSEVARVVEWEWVGGC